jgi:hypothetical protein
MKKVSALVAATAASGLLLVSGCATRSAGHEDYSNMDPKAMCEMHKQMMGSKTPEQQRAMMHEHMKTMSPEMRARMQEMHANCK